MKTPLSLLTGLVLLTTNLQAQTTWYMTRTGSGSRTGTSWSNAFSATSNPQVINIISGTLQAGDTLLIAGSTVASYSQPLTTTNTTTIVTLPPPDQDYRGRRIILGSAASGSATAPKIIRGVDMGHGAPVFTGTENTPSYASFELRENCSHITFENLDIRRREFGFTGTGTLHEGIVLRNVTTTSTKKGFYFVRSNDLLFENCVAGRYTQSGFKLHYACNRPTFRNCTADATQGDNAWIENTESPVGFDFHEKNKAEPNNTDILLDGCTARNNWGLLPSSYPQGDGFMVQQSNVGVVFRKCVADGATDSGYDLKGINQTINDSVAANCSKAGVKIWYQGIFNNFAAINNGGTMGNPQIRFAESGTFTYSGSIVFNNSTLHSGTSTQRGMTFEKANRSAQFNNCLFTFAGASGNYVNPVGYPLVTFNPSGTGAAVGRYANAGSGTNPPRYVNPVIPWNGAGTNYDNQTFGLSKGYNSTVVTPLPTKGVISVNLNNTSTNALAATDIVGVVPAENWNNCTTSLLTPLVDSTGATVDGSSAAFSSTTYGYANATDTQPPPLDDDSKMMRSQRAGSNTYNTTSTVTGLTYATYDVYVYWGGKPTTASAADTLTVELQQLDNGLYATSETRVMLDANNKWDGSYNESTATTTATAVDGQEYVVFRNVTTPEFRLRTTGATRTSICGFQVVEK